MKKRLRLSAERGFFTDKEAFNIAEGNPLYIHLEFVAAPAGEIFASWQFEGSPRRTVKVEDVLEYRARSFVPEASILPL